MEDAIRPSIDSFKRTYKRGYQTWSFLWESVAAEKSLQLDYFSDFCSATSNLPYFPRDLAVDKRFSNTVTVNGNTTWKTSEGACDLPSFQEDVTLQVASNHVTTVTFKDSYQSNIIANYIDEESNHIPILTLAWAYILSARWADFIPGASIRYTGDSDLSIPIDEDRVDSDSLVVPMGDLSADAARWWKAILCPGIGWDASILNNHGSVLHAPWSVKTQAGPKFIISTSVKPRIDITDYIPASSEAAARYLVDYYSLHQITHQSQAALAAALLIPLAKSEGRSIELPIPRLLHTLRGPQFTNASLSEAIIQSHMDRLLTLSCHSQGIKALLNSIFFDTTGACNDCGAWLQGTFAFLDLDYAADPRHRLRTLMERDRGLGALWLGAFITGTARRRLQEARAGWWKVDLSVAAWTGSKVSFIQDSVSKPVADTKDISRADECRLMYLSHELDRTTPPLFPFAPFGCTALEDTNLEVRKHAVCPAVHCLQYDGFTWNCDNGRKEKQSVSSTAAVSARSKSGPPLEWINHGRVSYDPIDFEDDVSEMVTRNIFTWLRGDDGFPVAERAIRQHEWIANLDSDDGTPIEGDTRTTVGVNLRSWFRGLSGNRSNSL